MKNKIIILICLINLEGFCQTIERSVIGSAGTTFNNNGFTVVSTVGEVAITTRSTSSIILIEGFNQPIISESLNVVQGINDGTAVHFSIYPNPTSSYLNIDVQSDWQSQTKITMTDLHGRMLPDSNYEKTVLHSGPTQIDLSRLSDGFYLLSIEEISTGTKRTFRIIKQN